MNKEFAKTKSAGEQPPGYSLDPAIAALREELDSRLSEAGFFGTVSLQINFRSGKQNWFRISSEYTKASLSNDPK
jgi:hypothetical protein